MIEKMIINLYWIKKWITNLAQFFFSKNRLLNRNGVSKEDNTYNKYYTKFKIL